MRRRTTRTAADAAGRGRRGLPAPRRHDGPAPATIGQAHRTESGVTTPDLTTIPDSEHLGWLAVGRTGVCNGHCILRALESLGSIRELFDAGERSLAAFGFPRAAVARIRGVDWDAVRRDRDCLERIGARILPIGTRWYPTRLAAIASPPPVLYCRGEPETLVRTQFAIVGSRSATHGGRARARMLARALAEQGLVVTSGLARGIDTAAHRGALDAGARSVAVLATGLDQVYPRSNAALAGELLEAGALVSERAPFTPPIPSNFPRRNRLISGLSLGVLVVEASVRSGSLITARFAADEGREVFAVPGSVDNVLSRGCHALIRDGAKLVESAADVLEEFAHLREIRESPVRTAPAPSDIGAVGDLDDSARTAVDAIGYDPVTLDELVERTGLTAERLASILLALELDDRIDVLPGGRWVRAAGRRG